MDDLAGASFLWWITRGGFFIRFFRAIDLQNVRLRLNKQTFNLLHGISERAGAANAVTIPSHEGYPSDGHYRDTHENRSDKCQ